jgi:hypothetical protein
MKEQIFDTLETMVLLALDGDKHVPYVGNPTKRFSGAMYEQIDQGDLIGIGNRVPNNFYTFDMADDTRLYTTDNGYLLNNPIDVLGDAAEIALFKGDRLDWTAYYKIKNRPKGVACLGKPAVWYEMHNKLILQDGSSVYHKRIVPLDSKGRALTAKIHNALVCSPNVEGEYLTIAASLIEDAHRPNTMLAEVKDGVTIKFPVPIDNYKELFANREEPLTPSGRRKAIVHWVAQHMRKSRNDTATVKKHVRGVQNICVGGVNITITPNDEGWK